MDVVPEEIKKSITKGERILYTRCPHPPKTLGCFVLTDKRIIIFLLSGASWTLKSIKKFSDYSWLDIKSISIDEGPIYSDIVLEGKFNKIEWKDLPRDEAEKIFDLALEMKKTALEGQQ